ncbi:flippase [Geomobilimonas luticola]|uniref:Flippase n=1 Tax=Geomobilimonas luticola TaxID=1114878 RepID=A0ABS5SF23_9BACT|nr:flippase [Geomobilimonas luticola]MBT0653114.1 flippase [Geomobilimonas luticola]
MSNVRALLQNAAVYSVSNILNAVIPFLLLPILTRVLPPSEYGVIAMFTATLGIMGAFTGLSVHGAVNVRYVDRDKIDFPRYVGSCLWVLLSSTFITLAVVTVFLAPLSKFAAVPPFWLLIAVLVSCCNFLNQIRLGIWMMASRPALYGAFQVAQSAVNMGLSLVFVLIMHQGYAGRLWGLTLATVLFATSGVVSLAKAGWVRFCPHLEYMRETLSFGLPLVPHVLGIFLMGVVDRFVINQKFGLGQAGIYMVAVQLSLGMSVVADAFNKAFVPWLYSLLNNDDLVSKHRLVRGTWIYFLIALGIAGTVALLSHWIIYIVAGAKYVGAAGALSGLAFGQAFGGMYLMVTNYIFYARKTRPLAMVTFVSGVLGFGLLWVLIPLLGIAGAGLANAITMFVRFLLTWALAQRVCPMPWLSFGKIEVKTQAI